MTFKTVSRIVLIVITLSILSIAEWTYWTTDYNKTQTYTLIQGPLDNKFASEEYACGSKKRYTCVDYYFVKDFTRYEVDQKLFTTTAVGDYVHLTKTVSVGNSGLEHVSRIIHWITAIGLFALTWVFGGLFIIWAVSHSDRVSFTEYLNED